MEKPVCKLVGSDGNVFALIGEVAKALNKAGQRDQVPLMQEEAFSSASYDDALRVFMKYVEIL